MMAATDTDLGERPDVVVVDHATLFASLPTAYLVMDRDLVIVDANASYLAMMGRTREELVGVPVFEAFPGPPEDVEVVRSSFERARDTGRPDPMPIVEYAIPEGDGFAQRYWSLISVPVLGEDGAAVLVAQRVEDVTDYVRARAQSAADHDAVQRGADWRRRFEQAEADLYARAQELRAAIEAKELAGRRLVALGEVALALTGAETVQQLTATVFSAGLPALGAAGGAVAVSVAPGPGGGAGPGAAAGSASGAVLELFTAESFARQVGAIPARLPLHGPLPPSVAARGTLVLVPDHAAAASVPGLSAASSLTGTAAWAALPLRVGERLLGSLTVAWSAPKEFTREEVDLLSAFAAQCAQALDRVQVRQAERLAAQRSQRLSESLQRSLLTPPPTVPDVGIAVRYQPAALLALVGGDWYDAFRIPDGAVSLVIGDVAGHDRDAAAAMGQVRTVLRGVAQALGARPAAVLAGLDRALHHLDYDVLATVVLAQLRPAPLLPGGWLLRWANAGHPPPLVVRADGAAHYLDGGQDALIGVGELLPGRARSDHEVPLGPGDTVVLYTDGLVERRGECLDDGLERLRLAAGQWGAAGALGPDQWCDALLERFGRDLDDDVALLVVQVC